MTRQTSPLTDNLAKIAVLLVVLLFSACKSATPQPQPTVAPHPESGAILPTPTTVADEETTIVDESPIADTPLPAATAAPGIAPGTTIVDQTGVLDAEQDGEIEILFDGVASQPIRLDVNLLDGGVDYELYLSDMFGNFVASIQPEVGMVTQSIAEFTLPYDGTYRIGISALDGLGTLQVVVTALGAASGGGVLDGPGSSLSARMSTGRVYHTYQFPLAEGQVVSIGAIASANGAPDVSLVLYGPDGRYVTEVDDVASPDDLNAILQGFVASVAGTYTAIVTNFGGTTGDYLFSVNLDTEPPPPEGEPDIVYDTSYRAAFFEQSNLNATFDGVTGDVLRVLAFDLDADLDVGIYLYSPFDQVIAFVAVDDAQRGDDQIINEVQLPYTGRYRLELRPVGSGEAWFQIVRLTHGDVTGGGTFGDELSGTLFGRFELPNVFHFFQFNAGAGDIITLIVRSVSETGQLDIAFAVIGPDGIQMAFADDSQGDSPADPELVAYPVAQTGLYTVVVYLLNDATGTYQLDFLRE